ncbi:MAG TPA: PEP-CTERM sorting domain-containing protein [Candidatus Methylacidiphilales bacterium]|nr:PEP-CTERM sorting domain-containing protein [Candidatus Methylacidiphilales bacterium]
MKTLLAVLSLSFVLALSARAQTFDFTFMGSSQTTIATGQFTLLDGIAQSGSLDITDGPNLGDYNLVALTSPGVDTFEAPDGTDYGYDDVVNVGSTPFLTSSGLMFSNATAGVNIYYDPGASSYAFFEGSAATNGFYGEITGVLTATPEPSSWALGLIGLAGLGGLGLIRRRAAA